MKKGCGRCIKNCSGSDIIMRVQTNPKSWAIYGCPNLTVTSTSRLMKDRDYKKLSQVVEDLPERLKGKKVLSVIIRKEIWEKISLEERKLIFRLGGEVSPPNGEPFSL